MLSMLSEARKSFYANTSLVGVAALANVCPRLFPDMCRPRSCIELQWEIRNICDNSQSKARKLCAMRVKIR